MYVIGDPTPPRIFGSCGGPRAPPPDPPAFWPEEVGVGTFGTVVRGNRDGTEVVGKAIHRMERQRAEIQAGVMTEVYALERCAGIATITQLWDLVMVGERFVLILEPWGKHLGDFLAFPGNRRADFLRKILGDVVAGVGYLHSPLRLLHADLKPNNVLVRAASATGGLPDARVADLGNVLQAALPPSKSMDPQSKSMGPQSKSTGPQSKSNYS